MECLACKTKMKCIDDVNDVGIRIDWLECPECGSKAEIQYDLSTGQKSKVTWTR